MRSTLMIIALCVVVTAGSTACSLRHPRPVATANQSTATDAAPLNPDDARLVEATLEPTSTTVSLSGSGLARGRTIDVSGTTSLPDGALLALYMTSQLHKTPSGDWTLPITWATVKGRRFATHVPIQATETAQHVFDVTVQFGVDPKDREHRQPRSVVALYGDHGQRMTGIQVTSYPDGSRLAFAQIQAVLPY